MTTTASQSEEKKACESAKKDTGRGLGTRRVAENSTERKSRRLRRFAEIDKKS